MPAAPVTDLLLDSRNRLLYAATYGRGCTAVPSADRAANGRVGLWENSWCGRVGQEFTVSVRGTMH